MLRECGHCLDYLIPLTLNPETRYFVRSSMLLTLIRSPCLSFGLIHPYNKSILDHVFSSIMVSTVNLKVHGNLGGPAKSQKYDQDELLSNAI